MSDAEETKLHPQSELADFYIEKAKGAFLKSRARWIEEEGKNSSYFFNLEKHNQAFKTINKLCIDNHISEEKTLSDDYIYSFHSDLEREREIVIFFLLLLKDIDVRKKSGDL